MAYQDRSFIWLNTGFVEEDRARVSVHDRGFLYGDGFFTTMRAEKGMVFFLEHHLERLENSCELFRIRFPEVLKDKGLYNTLLKKNGLDQGIAVVKIILTRGEENGIGLPLSNSPTCLVMARQYDPPSSDMYEKGWDLITFPVPRMTPIADHKSLNFLYNLWARQYALDEGVHEAILTDQRHHVMETATGTIVARFDDEWISPCGEGMGTGILPGITLKMLERVLEGHGMKTRKGLLKVSELKRAGDVWVLNSLMGIMPVHSIDGTILDRTDLHGDILAELWDYARRIHQDKRVFSQLQRGRK